MFPTILALAWAAPADLAAELLELDDAALLARLAQEMGAVSDTPADVARLTDAMGIAKALTEADLPPTARKAVIEAMVSDDPEDRAWARSQVEGSGAPKVDTSPSLSDAYDGRKLSLGPIHRAKALVTRSWLVTASWQDWTVYEGGFRALDGLETARILGDDEMVARIEQGNRNWKIAGTASLVGGAAATGVGIALLDTAFRELDEGPELLAGTALTSGGAGAITVGLIALFTKSYHHRFPSFAYKKDTAGLQKQIDTYNAELRREAGSE